MRHIKTRLSVAAAAVLLTAGLAVAQPESQTTFVTFDAPVALPGVTLGPGTYMFKLLDSTSNRHVVQVFDKERAKIYATIIAVAAERPQPADETVITFRESPANTPPAIRYWYYPGNTIGHEFAYPKEQAMLIAKASGESVLAYETEQSELARVDAAGQAAQMTQTQSTQSAATVQTTQTAQPPAEPQTRPTEPQAAPIERPEPTPTAPVTETKTSQEMQQPAPQPTPQPTDVQPSTPSPTGTSGRELPRTASELPLVGFLGLLALGGALVLRTLRVRVE